MRRATLIETARLKLRGIRREDAPYIVTWRSKPDNFRYFRAPHALSMEEHLQWFDDSYLKNENRCDWLALKKTTDQPVGVFGLIRRDHGLVEINYLLDEREQGKGYAAEAVSMLLDYAKTEWGALTAVAEIHKENKTSIDFAIRMGFASIDKTDNFIQYRKNL